MQLATFININPFVIITKTINIVITIRIIETRQSWNSLFIHENYNLMHFDISPIIPHTQNDQYTELPVMSSNLVNVLLPRFEARMFIGETKLCGHHHHVEQDVWGGITCFRNFPPCVCVCIGFIYLIPFYIFIWGGSCYPQMLWKESLLSPENGFSFSFSVKVRVYMLMCLCARWPSFPCLVIFHWSILPPRPPRLLHLP